MCKCTDFIVEAGCKICTSCGCLQHRVVESTIETVSYTQSYASFASSYSRKKRFKALVQALLWPCVMKADIPVIMFFNSLNRTIRVKDIEGLLRSMPNFEGRDRRYSSIHLFSKLFAEDYKKPEINRTLEEKMYMMFFAVEEHCVKTFGKRKSFAYVIRHCLEKLGKTELTQFLKLPRSRKC